MARSSDKIYSDVAVIGGGVIGSAAAYYLSKKNLEVSVIERGSIASGASGACDGYVFIQSKKDTDVICLTLKSLGIFKTLSEELSYDLEYRNCGGLVIYSGDYNHEDVSIIDFEDRFKGFLKNLVSGDRRDSNDFIEFVDKTKIKELEPFISEEVCFGTYCSYESQVNPLAVNNAYNLAAKNSGVQIYLNEEVTGFNFEDGKKITSLTTSSGRQVFAGEFLLCTGAWSADIGSALGIDIPVSPRKGTVLVTEAIPELINHVIIDYDYICCKFDKNREIGFTMEQTSTGNLLIGSTREFKGFDDSIDTLKASLLARRATELFPVLAGVDIIRMFNGFRPYSSDSRPFIGPVPGFQNLWIAAGHEGDGIALSPVTGMLMGELIVKKAYLSGDLERDFNAEPDLFYSSLYDKIEGFTGIDIRKFSPEKRIRFNP